MGGWCKVIIVSNPTVVEVVLSCIEVVVGVLTKCSLKCKKCEFEAKDTNGLSMHIKAKHGI